jgi:HK97 family phage prohead protease
MQRLTTSLSNIELKFAQNNATFEGYASVFGGVDSYNDTIERGAFANVVKSGRMPKMFENHRSWDIPIGKWTQMMEDAKGLYVKGEFTPNHPRAEMVRAAMLHGTVDGLSIGFRMSKDDFEVIEGRRHIKNVSELIEISAVTFPADSNARIDLESVKGELDSIETIQDLEAFLREAGGFSKGLAVAILARSKKILGAEPKRLGDEKAMAELQRLIDLPPLTLSLGETK